MNNIHVVYRVEHSNHKLPQYNHRENLNSGGFAGVFHMGIHTSENLRKNVLLEKKSKNSRLKIQKLPIVATIFQE